MYDILTLNKISKTGLERFTDEYQYGDAVENPQGIMVLPCRKLWRWDTPEV